MRSFRNIIYGALLALATVEGKHSVAVSVGHEGVASAAKTGAIVLVYRDPLTDVIKHIFASKVGENGIEADVLYRLGADGKPVKPAA